MEEIKTTVQELNQLGENLLKAGKVDDAYEYFCQAEKEYPTEITSYINQAKVLLSRGDAKGAKKALDKALLLDNRNPDALFYLSSACFLSGLYEDGLLYAGQAADAGCNEPMLYLNMAVASEELGQIDRALRYHNKAVNLAPLEGRYYTAKAECQMRNGRDDDALQTLMLLRQNCPDSFEVYHYSYLIYVRRLDYDKARQILAEGIENFPGDVGLYVDMVHLMNLTRHPAEALQLLDALEEVKDSVPMDRRELALERAKAYVVDSRIQEAKDLLQEVILMEGAANFEAHYLLMNCALSLQDYPEMERVARIMVEADDHTQYSRSARYYLPMSLMKQDRAEEALPLYEEAIRYYRTETLKHPELVDGYLFRALCCKDLKRFDDALKVLDYVDKLLPQYQPAQMIRASVYLEQGDKARAAEAYRNTGSLKSVLDDVIGPLMKEE